MLTNGDFGNQLNNWLVWVDPNDFNNQTLYAYSHHSPGNSAPAAFLGAENDASSTGPDLVDQRISQQVQLPPNTQAVAFEYSHCLKSQETSPNQVYDSFKVNLQQPLGGNSIFGQTLRYTNLAASTNCLANSGNWQRSSHYVYQASPYADQLISLVFYSDVDHKQISTFYFDAVKIKVCTN